MSLASKRSGASVTQEDRSRRQERADRILDAAAELILRWGYKKTTIDDIAKQAGVAKGTIYLHWKTREDLFLALLTREDLKLAEDMKQRICSLMIQTCWEKLQAESTVAQRIHNE